MPPALRKRVSENSGTGASGSSSLKKKRNTSGNSRRSKNHGKLALLLEMPIEIFTEMSCYMSPLDLLNLARTSAGLRELLMSKSSKRIWEAVRLIHDIPDCLPDLSEPQYVNLLFGNGCNFCSATRAIKPYFVLRFRACKTCFKKQTIDEYQIYRECGPCLKHFLKCTTFPCVEATVEDFPSKRFAVLHFEEVMLKANKLSGNPADFQKYISERQEFTSDVVKHTRAMEEWLERESLRQADSKRLCLAERRSSIEGKLRGLGFDDDDLSDRYDEEDWKWEQFFNQSRPLTNSAWQNMKPQLKRTIQLRRTYVGHKFYKDRLTKRVEEMKSRFRKSRSALGEFYLGRLLTIGDFLELPVVKIMIEEDGCRVPLTDERWQRVVEVFSYASQNLVKTIERDCVWDFRDSILQTNRGDLRILFEADTNVWDPTMAADDFNDEIPTCLLSAAALFERKDYGTSCLDGFAEILRKRSLLSLESIDQDLEPWGEERIESSPSIITTALTLLEHLILPKETTMTFMLACGEAFRCNRCSMSSMSWVQLVQHFVSKTEAFEHLQRESRRRNLSVPIRNGHNLLGQTDGIAAERSLRRIDVAMMPTSENANRYSTLSISWGKSLYEGPFLEELMSDDSEEELESEIQWCSMACRLCRTLGYSHREATRDRMSWHMRLNHGTDIEGNLLPECV